MSQFSEKVTAGSELREQTARTGGSDIAEEVQPQRLEPPFLGEVCPDRGQRPVLSAGQAGP